jgi:Tol biopolymer transport system component
MGRVIRRALGAGALALLLVTGTAMAAVPSGPRLAVVRAGAKGPELVSVNQSGGDPVRLAGGGWRSRPIVDFFSPVSWSADGSALAFSGIVSFEKGDDHEAIQKIFTVGADGSGLRAIRGTREALGPILSPDGRTVAFTRTVDRETPTTVGGRVWKEFHGSSVWTVDLPTGRQHQLTAWRDGLRYTASSFSPDGKTLLATVEGDGLTYEPQPVALNPDGSVSRRIYNDGFSPVYSPDGSRIALVRHIQEYGTDGGGSTDLFVLNADGTGLRRLTHTPGRAELSPTWDPSGERLAYVRLPGVSSDEAPFGSRAALMQVNADATCQEVVVSKPATFFFTPAWQPGPGRGAGRIEC